MAKRRGNPLARRFAYVNVSDGQVVRRLHKRAWYAYCTARVHGQVPDLEKFGSWVVQVDRADIVLTDSTDFAAELERMKERSFQPRFGEWLGDE